MHQIVAQIASGDGGGGDAKQQHPIQRHIAGVGKEGAQGRKRNDEADGDGHFAGFEAQEDQQGDQQIAPAHPQEARDESHAAADDEEQSFARQVGDRLFFAEHHHRRAVEEQQHKERLDEGFVDVAAQPRSQRGKEEHPGRQGPDESVVDRLSADIHHAGGDGGGRPGEEPHRFGDGKIEAEEVQHRDQGDSRPGPSHRKEGREAKGQKSIEQIVTGQKDSLSDK